MGTTASGEVENLERLRADEVSLDRVLDEARRAAEGVLSEAHAEAGRLAAAAAARVEEEAVARREEAARALSAVEAEVRREIDWRLSELRRRAEANRERAAAAMVERVLGEWP